MINSRRELLLAVGGGGMDIKGEAGDTKPTQDKSTALDSEQFRQAVLAGDIATVTSMLDRDPDLRYARDSDGVSVYILACLKGQAKVAEELVRRGLVLNIFEASASGNTPRVNELGKDNALIARHHLPDGRTPLHLAAAAGKADTVTALANRNADLSAGPESPLLFALNHPDHAVASEMSRFLLMNASDPNARRRDGKSALHIAAARGYDDLVQMLIHRGAATDVRDADGKTPLAVATGPAIPTLQHASSIERVSYAPRYTQDLTGKPVPRDRTSRLPHESANQCSQ